MGLKREFLGRNLRFYALAGILTLVAAAIVIVGIAFVADYRATQNRPNSAALRIEGEAVPLSYFTQRMKMYIDQIGGIASQEDLLSSITGVIDELTTEEALRRFSGELGLASTDEEINAELASRLGLKPDDPNLSQRLQEELTRSGLEEEEYRLMLQASVLESKARSKFQNDLPANAESLHYRQIVVRDLTEAEEIKKQIEGGADFAELAKEKSLDSSTKDKGGDAGWIPRGVLPLSSEDQMFGSTPGAVNIISTSGGSVIYQVLEKPVERPIDQGQKPRLAEAKLREWLDGKKQAMEVRDLVSNDEDKLKWAFDRIAQTG